MNNGPMNILVYSEVKGGLLWPRQRVRVPWCYLSTLLQGRTICSESQSSRLTSVAYLHVHALKRQFPVGAQRPERWGLSACLSVNSGNEQPHEPDPCGQPFSVGPLS